MPAVQLRVHPLAGMQANPKESTYPISEVSGSRTTYIEVWLLEPETLRNWVLGPDDNGSMLDHRLGKFLHLTTFLAPGIVPSTPCICTPRVQLPNYKVSTPNYDYDSCYGNPKYPGVRYFGPLGVYYCKYTPGLLV